MVKKTAMLLLGAVALTGCCTPDASAERQMYNVIAEPYLNYVHNDPLLDPEQKQRRVRLVKSWGIRLDAQEKAQGGK